MTNFVRRTAICSIPLVLGLTACDTRTPSSSSARTTTPAPRAPDTTVQRPAPDVTPRDTTLPAPSNPVLNNNADQRLSADIQQVLMARSDLSADGQNCQISAKDGVVTLRGTVASQAEKDSIASIVQSTPGVTSVVNELEVKS